MCYVVTARKSVSSLQFSKEVGITQKTAWFLIHKVREAMTQDDRSLLCCIVVEVDETYHILTALKKTSIAISE